MTDSYDRSKIYPCCGAIRGTTHKLSCLSNPHRMPPPQRRATFDPPDMDDEPVYLGVDPAKPDSDESITFITEGHMITPVMTLQPQPINIAFNDDNGREVGKFEYDKEAKRWTFEGNMDAAAKQFAKFMYAHFQSIIEGDRDEILNTPVVPADFEEKLVKSIEKVWPETTPMPGSLNHKTFKQIYEGKF